MRLIVDQKSNENYGVVGKHTYMLSTNFAQLFVGDIVSVQMNRQEKPVECVIVDRDDETFIMGFCDNTYSYLRYKDFKKSNIVVKIKDHSCVDGTENAYARYSFKVVSDQESVDRVVLSESKDLICSVVKMAKTKEDLIEILKNQIKKLGG